MIITTQSAKAAEKIFRKFDSADEIQLRGFGCIIKGYITEITYDNNNNAVSSIRIELTDLNTYHAL